MDDSVPVSQSEPKKSTLWPKFPVWSGDDRNNRIIDYRYFFIDIFSYLFHYYFFFFEGIQCWCGHRALLLSENALAEMPLNYFPVTFTNNYFRISICYNRNRLELKTLVFVLFFFHYSFLFRRCFKGRPIFLFRSEVKNKFNYTLYLHVVWEQ